MHKSLDSSGKGPRRRGAQEDRSAPGRAPDFRHDPRKETLGRGHAVLSARELVGNEPFAVLVADDVIADRLPSAPGLAIYGHC